MLTWPSYSRARRTKRKGYGREVCAGRSRSAFLWPEEARQSFFEGRPLVELKGVDLQNVIARFLTRGGLGAVP